jgi:hypothetical protein
MPDLNKIASQLKNSLFAGDEFKKRMASNVVRMIVGDITTLYSEFKANEGAGALFFNPSNPTASQYLALTDIYKDRALAEEMLHDDLAKFLDKLANIVTKQSDSNLPVVVMVHPTGMSIHILDTDKVDEVLEEHVKDAN